MKHFIDTYITHMLTITLLSWTSDTLSPAQALQCPPCGRIHCHPKKASQLRCKGGVTTGVCNCCPTCAKIKGERCGGDYNYMGKCDRGLTCKTRGGDAPLFPSQQEPLGICEISKCIHY